MKLNRLAALIYMFRIQKIKNKGDKSMKNIQVQYKFEGTIHECDTEMGILIDENRVFVTEDRIAIYEAEPTDDPCVYVVDVDKDAKNLLNNDHNMLLDLLQPLIS